MKKLIFSISLLVAIMTVSPAKCYAQHRGGGGVYHTPYHNGLNGNGSYYNHNRQGIYSGGNFFLPVYSPTYYNYNYNPYGYGNYYGNPYYVPGYNYNYNYNFSYGPGLR